MNYIIRCQGTPSTYMTRVSSELGNIHLETTDINGATKYSLKDALSTAASLSRGSTKTYHLALVPDVDPPEDSFLKLHREVPL